MGDAPGMCPFIVEFAGARGAGKSTLRRHVSGILVDQDPTAWAPPRPSPKAITTRLHAVGRSIAGWYDVRSWLPPARPGVQASRTRSIIRGYRVNLLLYHRFRLRAGGHLVDHGLCQLMQELMIHAEVDHAAGLWRRLIRRTPPPDAVVFVDTSEEVIAAQRRQRGSPRDLRASSMTVRQRDAVRELRSWLREVSMSDPPAFQVVFVEDVGTRDPHDIAREIVRVIADGPYRAASQGRSC